MAKVGVKGLKGTFNKLQRTASTNNPQRLRSRWSCRLWMCSNTGAGVINSILSTLFTASLVTRVQKADFYSISHRNFLSSDV